MFPKYFQTLPWEKWRSFANSLRSMLKLCMKFLASSTVHEVAWHFNNLACSCGLMFDRVISTICF